MQLLDLPDEVLQLCCPETDLDKVRLTCKRLAILSSKLLFAHVRLWPTARSAEKLQCILNDGLLAPLVDSITVQASIIATGCAEPIPTWNVDLKVGASCGNDHVKSENEYGVEIDDGTPTESTLERELSTAFKQTLSQIGRLRNIRRLKLIYDDYVRNPRSSPIILSS